MLMELVNQRLVLIVIHHRIGRMFYRPRSA